MKKKGFTLIELLVVISIIALLLSILVPSLGKAKEVAKRVVCATNLKSLGEGVYTYAISNNDQIPLALYKTDAEIGDSLSPGGVPLYSYMMMYLKGYLSPDELAELSPKQRVHPFPSAPWANGGKWGFGELFMSDIVEEGEVFYCPGTKRPPDDNMHFAYKYYSANESTFPFFDIDNSSGHENRVRSSYMYVPQQSNKKVQLHPDVSSRQDYFLDTARKTEQLGSSNVLACDVLISLEWLPHKKGKNAGGVNVLYSDGSVSFANNPDAFSDSLWKNGNGGSVYISGDAWLFRTVLELLEQH